MRSPRDAFRLEALPSLLPVVLAIVLVVLIAASCLEYVSVAQAHALPGVEIVPQVAFQGVDATGNLTANGSVSLTVALKVVNPSSRALFFEQAVVKAWILDEPAQAGLPNLGRADPVLVNSTGTWRFFPAVFGSTALDYQRVPAGGNGSVSVTLNLSRATDSAAFQVVRNITAFARGRGMALSAIPWNWHALVSLLIDNVPAPSSASSADYLFAITRDVLQQGVDLGA